MSSGSGMELKYFVPVKCWFWLIEWVNLSLPTIDFNSMRSSYHKYNTFLNCQIKKKNNTFSESLLSFWLRIAISALFDLWNFCSRGRPQAADLCSIFWILALLVWSLGFSQYLRKNSVQHKNPSFSITWIIF